MLHDCPVRSGKNQQAHALKIHFLVQLEDLHPDCLVGVNLNQPREMSLPTEWPVQRKKTFDFDSAFETWCGIYRPPTSQGTRRCKMPLWMSVFHSHFALRFQLRHLHWSHHPADLYIWAGHGRSALLDHLEQRVGCGESWHMPGQICICFLQFWFQFSFMCVSVLRNPWSKLQLLH